MEVHGTYIGLIEKPCIRNLTPTIQKEFNLNCFIHSVGDTQLYGSKVGALFGRNTLKDSFDLYHLLKEGINLKYHKKGILYSLLGSSLSITNLFDLNYNELPIKYEDQYAELGSPNYSLERHIETRKKIKKQVLNMLNEENCYYILSSALGVLGETDYEFNHMNSIVTSTKSNGELMKMNSKTYRQQINGLFEMLPIKSDRINSLFKKYILPGIHLDSAK